MRFRHAVVVIAVLLAAAGCGPPKYVSYQSIHRDWKTQVPWGWNVITDDEGTHYAATNFLGPFEPDFFLGIPSFSIRWHAHGIPHSLRGKGAEVYFSADDYVKKTLSEVYGPEYRLEQQVRDVVVGDNRKAKNFVVLSPVPAPEGARWGTSQDPESKRIFNFRQHEYVVVPLDRGFYVLIYPATRDGFSLYKKQFNKLVNSFVVLSSGPGGPKPEAAKPAFATKAKS